MKRSPLDEGPHGYEIFQKKLENVMRVVFTPHQERKAA